MLDVKKTALHAHPSSSVKLRASLLPLQKALTAAERESPSRPHFVDANERRALQLIARMQAEYKRVFPFVKETAG